MSINQYTTFNKLPHNTNIGSHILFYWYRPYELVLKFETRESELPISAISRVSER